MDHRQEMGFDANKLYTMKRNRLSNTLRPAKSLSSYSVKTPGVTVRVKMLPANDSRNNIARTFSNQRVNSVSGIESESLRVKSNR